MNLSDELKNVMLHFYQSLSSGNTRAVEALVSHQSGVLAIGSDPAEWWTDYGMIMRVFRMQMQELAGTHIEAGELRAYVEDSVGWIADSPAIKLPDGGELRFRWTAVFHKEDGEWKMIQSHASIGVSNEDAVGKELTTE